MGMPVYLDCAATTPMEPAVIELVLKFMTEEFGNAGSRTHEFGARAKQAVQKSRDQISAVVACEREEVVFTSGATESNNLALLGLAEHGDKTGRKHIVSTAIEHKAVLEPLEELSKRGFAVEYLQPNIHGWIDVSELKAKLRSDTLLVSIMHANNETGVLQPIDDVSDVLRSHEAFLHVDASQSFGKIIEPLRNRRIDLLSASAHKIFGPKGIGALIARRRGFDRLPLRPLAFGGGQERGLRPGTLPVSLIVGFGAAAEMALKKNAVRERKCYEFRAKLETALMPLGARIHGDPSRSLPHILNVSVPRLDSEAVMVALKGDLALSNGSACTSASYSPSHVLKAMRLPDEEIRGALRFSWCHLTPEVDWERVTEKLDALRNALPAA